MEHHHGTSYSSIELITKNSVSHDDRIKIGRMGNGSVA